MQNIIKISIAQMLLLALMTTPRSSARADEMAKAINAANELLRADNVTQAVERYRAIEAQGGASDALHYNLAAGLYRQGNFESAAELFAKAAGSTDQELAARSRYNLGNCRYAEGLAAVQGKNASGANSTGDNSAGDKQLAIAELTEAIEHYRAALRSSPKLVDARANIELASRLIDQLQQQNPEPEKQQQQDPEQQDPEQQEPEQQDPEQQEPEQQEPEQQDSGQEQSDQQNQAGQGQDSQSQQKAGDSKQENAKQENSGQQNGQQQSEPEQDGQKQKDQQQNGEGSDGDTQNNEQPAQPDQESGGENASPQPSEDQRGGDQDSQNRNSPQSGVDPQSSTEQQSQAGQQEEPTESAALDGSLSSDNSQSHNPLPVVGDGKPIEESTLMNREEAMKLLQSIRDRDMIRRFQLQKREQRRAMPTDRDW